MAVSLKASKEGLAMVELARKKKGWTATDIMWLQAAETTEATLKRFRNGSSVQKDSFIAICKAVGISNWEEIVENFIKDGGNIISLEVGNLTDETKQLIFQASQQYWQNYQDRHCLLKVLGMREPVRLESIYTEVQFLSDRDILNFTSVDSLEKAFRETAQRSYQRQNISTQAGLQAAKEKQYLMVLGSPGSGKSTFLRRIGLEALKGSKGNYQHGCLPVFVELKRFNNSDISLENFIIEEFKPCGFPNQEELAQKLLQQGKLLILLDGLDEIPSENLNVAISQIQDFVDKYHKNRFIISCRTAAYRSGFRRFSDVTIAEFDNTQIENFINNWFGSEQDKQAGTAKKCWEILQRDENQAAKELGQTPLLLTFLCLIYDRSQKFPDNRSVLYRKALRILLEEWASEKRILRDEIYSGLHTELEEILLSEIAHKGFQADRLFFEEREIIQDIKSFLAGNLNAPQNLDGKAVLDAIAVQQGILVERAEDIYSFSHLTLQEYLTAQYIDDNRQVEQLVTQHLTDRRWKEVFLLVAGLMRGGADELLLQMEKQAQTLIDTPKLKALLNWAEEETVGSEGNFKPVGKRAIANAIAYAIANAIAYAYANAYAYAYAIINDNAIANAYANAYANANAIAYAYAIPNANAYAIANAIAYAYDNAYDNAIANAIANAYAYANAIANANANAYVNAYAYANANAYAIAYAKNITESIDYYRIIDELKVFKNQKFQAAIARLEELKTKITDKDRPLEERKEFANQLWQTYLQTFNFDLEMVTLSEAELQAWDNYLYANLLIVQCQRVAVRVSPSTWAAIEERMLLSPQD